MAFAATVIGNQGAIPSYSDVLSALFQIQPSVASLVSAGVADTLTGYQIDAGIFVRSGATAAVAVTTDTAANIISAIGPNAAVGMSVMLMYVNLNTSSGAVTVAAGTGVTTSGTMTIPIAGMRVFVLTVTNIVTPAITIQGAFSIGSGVAA